jgi:hypothetical protein
MSQMKRPEATQIFGKKFVRDAMNVQPNTSSAHPDFLRSVAFLKMSSQQQKNFIERRFGNMDATELLRMVKAIYGHPHDKGRPKVQSRPKPQETK